MRPVPSPVPESSWVLTANGDRIDSGTASPGMERKLAAGLLLSNGFVRSPTDIHSIQSRQDSALTAYLDARIDEAAHASAMAERRHRRQAECDLLHFVVCAPEGLRRARTAALPGREDLVELLRMLFDLCQRQHPGGGVHAAAVAGGGVKHDAVDVGRHSAVDKAIGAAFLAGATMPDLGLVLTSRISGRIAQSAARSGVSWIASRSVPTTLAMAVCGAAGVQVVARAASPDFHIFNPAARGGDA